jgi:hypothetical protein
MNDNRYVCSMLAIYTEFSNMDDAISGKTKTGTTSYKKTSGSQDLKKQYEFSKAAAGGEVVHDKSISGLLRAAYLLISAKGLNPMEYAELIKDRMPKVEMQKGTINNNETVSYTMNRAIRMNGVFSFLEEKGLLDQSLLQKIKKKNHAAAVKSLFSKRETVRNLAEFEGSYVKERMDKANSPFLLIQKYADAYEEPKSMKKGKITLEEGVFLETKEIGGRKYKIIRSKKSSSIMDENGYVITRKTKKAFDNLLKSIKTSGAFIEQAKKEEKKEELLTLKSLHDELQKNAIRGDSITREEELQKNAIRGDSITREEKLQKNAIRGDSITSKETLQKNILSADQPEQSLVAPSAGQVANNKNALPVGTQCFEVCFEVADSITGSQKTDFSFVVPGNADGIKISLQFLEEMLNVLDGKDSSDKAIVARDQLAQNKAFSELLGAHEKEQLKSGNITGISIIGGKIDKDGLFAGKKTKSFVFSRGILEQMKKEILNKADSVNAGAGSKAKELKADNKMALPKGENVMPEHIQDNYVSNLQRTDAIIRESVKENTEIPTDMVSEGGDLYINFTPDYLIKNLKAVRRELMNKGVKQTKLFKKKAKDEGFKEGSAEWNDFFQKDGGKEYQDMASALNLLIFMLEECTDITAMDENYVENLNQAFKNLNTASAKYMETHKGIKRYFGMYGAITDSGNFRREIANQLVLNTGTYQDMMMRFIADPNKDKIKIQDGDFENSVELKQRTKDADQVFELRSRYVENVSTHLILLGSEKDLVMRIAADDALMEQNCTNFVRSSSDVITLAKMYVAISALKDMNKAGSDWAKVVELHNTASGKELLQKARNLIQNKLFKAYMKSKDASFAGWAELEKNPNAQLSSKAIGKTKKTKNTRSIMEPMLNQQQGMVMNNTEMNQSPMMVNPVTVSKKEMNTN